MATQRLSLTTLVGWDNSPVTRFSPLPVPNPLPAVQGVVFTLDTDVFELTPTGSTFNNVATLQGRLPTAAELDGSPYYHMHVRASAAVAATNPQDVIEVLIDGERTSFTVLPTTPQVADTTTIEDGNTTVLLIPKTATSVQFIIDTGAGNLPYLMDYSFSVPQEADNRLLNQPLSVEELEQYSASPLATVFGGEVNLTAGDVNKTALVLPTEAQLGGAPWYYLSARMYRQANPPVNDMIIGLYFNASTVPSEWFIQQSGGTDAETLLYLPYPERIAPAYSDFLDVDPTYTRLSAGHVTSLEVWSPFGANDDCVFQYSYLIPVLQNQ
jgi:hypothetical protein